MCGLKQHLFCCSLYTNGGPNSNHGKARVGTVSNGSDIAFNSTGAIFNPSNNDNISCTVLNSTSFAVAYREDDGNSRVGKALIGTISNGSDIVFSSTGAVFTPAVNIGEIGIAALSSTEFVVVNHEVSGGRATTGEVSGSTITYSSTGTIFDPNVGALSSSSVTNIGGFIVAYRNSFNSGYHGTAIHGQKDSQLPVELVRFKAQKEETTVRLYWETATENFNEGFIIERSTASNDWESIGFVSGHGNSVETHQYEFRDERPLNGINYYRLVQQDWDGQTRDSKTVSVDFGSNGQITMQVVPNPVQQGQASIHLTTFEFEEAHYQMFDEIGRLVEQKMINLKPGYKNFNRNWSALTPGIYYVKIDTGTQVITQKVLIE